MITPAKTLVRPATSSDRSRLASLIHFESHVHRHLDWRPALEWLGHEPYLVAERRGQVVAALACPPDPPEVSWIRVFACSDTLSPAYAWQAIWPAALEQLEAMACTRVAALPMHAWFREVLAESAFSHVHRVISLSWKANGATEAPSLPWVNIRPMTSEDLPAVQAVDAAAFEPIWQNSLNSLELAFKQAMLATVAEDEDGVVGYQISTYSPLGGHLARLAVHPDAQRRGLGTALIRDMQSEFLKQGIRRVTVNTQHDNQDSLVLYDRTGFQRTGEEYPVYLLDAV